LVLNCVFRQIEHSRLESLSTAYRGWLVIGRVRLDYIYLDKVYNFGKVMIHRCYSQIELLSNSNLV